MPVKQSLIPAQMMDPQRGMFDVPASDYNTVLGGIHGGVTARTKQSRGERVSRGKKDADPSQLNSKKMSKRITRLSRRQAYAKALVEDPTTPGFHLPGSQNPHKPLSIKK